MKPTKIHAVTTLLSVAIAAVLGGCGGGGDDEAGSPTEFSVQPETKTVTSDADACYAGYVGDFYVYGGTAPYRLDISDPDAVLIHKSMTDATTVATVNERGGRFSVTFTGICLSPSSVIIKDKLDNVVVLTLNNKPGT